MVSVTGILVSVVNLLAAAVAGGGFGVWFEVWPTAAWIDSPSTSVASFNSPSELVVSLMMSVAPFSDRSIQC